MASLYKETTNVSTNKTFKKKTYFNHFLTFLNSTRLNCISFSGKKGPNVKGTDCINVFYFTPSSMQEFFNPLLLISKLALAYINKPKCDRKYLIKFFVQIPGEILVAWQDYRANGSDELDLQEGDQVELIEINDPALSVK